MPEALSPIKPFESMAAGKAVVVSSVAALAETVQDRTTGQVFDKGSIVDIVDSTYREILTARTLATQR